MSDGAMVTPAAAGGRGARAGWSRRVADAWTTLQSPATMVPLQRLYDAMDPQGEPRASLVAGQDRVKRAHSIGLLPGSFNPLTRAHLALARAARRSAQLDLVIFAVAARTVDKEGVTRASIPDRLAQLAAYARRDTGSAVVLLNRGLYVEQAKALGPYIAGSAARLAIIVGFDKVVQILDPRYYANRDAALADLFSRARLLAAPRAEEDEAALDALLLRPDNRAYAAQVSYLDLPPRYRQDSATQARRLLADAGDAETAFTGGDDARALVPPEGYALALLGPYAALTSPTAETPARSDRYAERTRWLAALRGVDDAQLASLPPLDRLVRATLANTCDNGQLRAWLDTAVSERSSAALGALGRLLSDLHVQQAPKQSTR